MSDDDDRDQIIAQLRQDEKKLRQKVRELESSSAGHNDALSRARSEAAAEKEAELLASHHRALNEAEVRIRAARRFNDPDDAVRFLDLDSLGASGGKIDAAKLDEAIGEVLEAKPYLGVDAGSGTREGKNEEERPAPSNGNGSRVTGDGGGGARTVGHSSPDTPMNDALRKMAHRR